MAGLSISNIATTQLSANMIAGYVCGCVAYCASEYISKDADAAKIINVGQMRTLLNMGCSHLSLPMNSWLSLVEVKTSTGEPCAGKPHARFGGRGNANQCVILTPIGVFLVCAVCGAYPTTISFVDGLI